MVGTPYKSTVYIVKTNQLRLYLSLTGYIKCSYYHSISLKVWKYNILQVY